MKGFSLRLPGKGNLYDTVRHIIPRNQTQRGIRPHGENAHSAQEHLFQNIVNRIEIPNPAGPGISHNHTGAADGKGQARGTDQPFRLRFALLIVAGKGAARGFFFRNQSSLLPGHIRRGDMDKPPQFRETGGKGKRLRCTDGIRIKQHLSALLKANLRARVQHMGDSMAQ